MITSLFLIAAVTPSPLPDDLLNGEGFETTIFEDQSKSRKSGKGHHGRFKNALGEEIVIDCGWASEKSHVFGPSSGYGSRQHRNDLANRFAALPTMRSLPSNLPPRVAGTWQSKLGVTIVAAAPNSGVTVTYSTRFKNSAKGFADPQPFDVKERAAFVERVARHTLANAAGMRLSDSGAAALAGRSIKKADCRRSGRVFGNLQEWTNLEGWSIAEDDYGVLSLKKGAKWAVLPLGADQIKVNGVWKDMGDSAAFLNGKLYLPAAGLEHLRGA
jgi:hypothetical protein